MDPAAMLIGFENESNLDTLVEYKDLFKDDKINEDYFDDDVSELSNIGLVGETTVATGNNPNNLKK